VERVAIFIAARFETSTVKLPLGAVQHKSKDLALAHFLGSFGVATNFI